MDWSNEDIINSFNGIINDSKVLGPEELEKKYYSFKESFMKLYEVAINSSSGDKEEKLKMLNLMLRARDKMKSGAMSKLSTDMHIGNELGIKYVYPKTGKPTPEDFKRASSELKRRIDGGKTD